MHLEIFQQPRFEIPEHQHTMHVIAYGLPPEGGLDAGGSGYALGERWLDGKLRKERRNAGDIAIIPAGICHRCNWSASVQFGILAVEPALLKRVAQDWVNAESIELIPQFMDRPDRLIEGIISALKDELEFGKVGGQLLVDSLKTTLAVHLLRNYCVTSPKRSRYAGGLSPAQLALVKDYINAHLNEVLQLADMAAIAQISQFHFSRLFKQNLGMTPHQYVLQSRIDRAKHLLRHSDLSIADIAAQSGFCDQSHLTRCFRRLLGMTPKQFLQI